MSLIIYYQSITTLTSNIHMITGQKLTRLHIGIIGFKGCNNFSEQKSFPRVPTSLPNFSLSFKKKKKNLFLHLNLHCIARQCAIQ